MGRMGELAQAELSGKSLQQWHFSYDRHVEQQRDWDVSPVCVKG
jgi:hypothetical protein